MPEVVTQPVEDLTRRQASLIAQLRDLDSQISHLSNKRIQVRAELERIYPEARRQVTQRVPKEQATVLSIFNHEANGFDCIATITPSGRKAIETFSDATLTDADIIILALCTSPANAQKLIKFPELLAVHARPSSRVHRMFKAGYLNLEFPMKVHA